MMPQCSTVFSKAFQDACVSTLVATLRMIHVLLSLLIIFAAAFSTTFFKAAFTLQVVVLLPWLASKTQGIV